MTSLPDVTGPVSSPPPTQPLHGFPPNFDDTFITERLVNEPTWPKDRMLDIDKYNWPEWSYRIRLLADRMGLGKWLSGTLPRPDPNIYPKASQIWQTNDLSLRAFLLLNISEFECDEVMHYETSSEVFEQLRKRHEKCRRYAQVLLMKQAFDTHFERNTPLMRTANKLKELHRRILSLGEPDPDTLLSAYIINALRDLFSCYLQPDIRTLMEQPDYTSDALIRLIMSKEAFLKRQMMRNDEARTIQRASSAKLPRARGKSHAANAPSTQLTNM